MNSDAKHHAICEWHLDQYDFECTCGATAPKAEWFDRMAHDYRSRTGSFLEKHSNFLTKESEREH